MAVALMQPLEQSVDNTSNAKKLVRYEGTRDVLARPLPDDKYLYDLFPELVKYIKTVAWKTVVALLHVPPPPLLQLVQIRSETLTMVAVRTVELRIVQQEWDQAKKKKILDAILFLEYVRNHSTMLVDELTLMLETAEPGENILNKIRELKKHLLQCTLFLNEALSHYTHAQVVGISLPTVSEIRDTINDIKGLIKNFKLGDLDKIFPDKRPIQVTVDDITCYALGLSASFTNQFVRIPEEERQHQTDEYLIQQMLQDRYEEEFLFNEQNPDISEENLNRIGFSETKAKILFKLLQRNPLYRHQSLIYWAKHFIQDAFRHDILLNNAAFQLYPDSVLSTDCPALTETADREQHVAQFRYIKSPSSINTSHDEQNLLFFHGTDLTSALNIESNGIILKKGNAKQNFSDNRGFYMTPDVKGAINWAQHTQFSPYAAVVAFEVSQDTLDKFSGFDVSSDVQIWKNVISYNRSGRDRTIFKLPADTKKEYNKADYVVGPVCINGGEFDIHGRECLQQGETDEICILTQKMADIISGSIVSVWFWNNEGTH